MKNILFSLAFGILMMNSGCVAQFGYTQYSITDGLKISYKWGKAKDEEGNKRTALLIRAENVNDFPVSYEYNIDLYYEGVLRETGEIRDNCLKPRQTTTGKLNGTYFIPQKFTDEQLNSSDFNLEFNEISAEQIETCDTEEE